MSILKACVVKGGGDAEILMRGNERIVSAEEPQSYPLARSRETSRRGRSRSRGRRRKERRKPLTGRRAGHG